MSSIHCQTVYIITCTNKVYLSRITILISTTANINVPLISHTLHITYVTKWKLTRLRYMHRPHIHGKDIMSWKFLKNVLYVHWLLVTNTIVCMCAMKLVAPIDCNQASPCLELRMGLGKIIFYDIIITVSLELTHIPRTPSFELLSIGRIA